MSATVLVRSNPYFATPGSDRRYVIDDVPEGDYTIVGFHDRATPVVKRSTELCSSALESSAVQ